MAKSIRSKSRRKFRNVNREHFAKRELERLYKCVKTGKKELVENVKLKSDKKKDESCPITSTSTEIKEDATMEVDKSILSYDKKTKRDENGHYPPWMNQRAIKKHKKKLSAKKKKGKVLKW